MEQKKHYFTGREKGYTVDELHTLNGKVVSRGTIYERLSQGRSFEEIIGNGSKPKQKRHKGKKLINFQGKEYTLDELLELPIRNPEVTRTVLNLRLLRGNGSNEEIEKALTKGTSRNTTRSHAVLYTYKCKEYSAKELHKLCSYSISEKTFRDRLKEHPVEIVLNCPEAFKKKPISAEEKRKRHREYSRKYRERQCQKSKA